MPASINLWKMQIGTFKVVICKLCVEDTYSSIPWTKFKHSFVCFLIFLITVISFLLILSNGIELNPAPKKDYNI